MTSRKYISDSKKEGRSTFRIGLLADSPCSRSSDLNLPSPKNTTETCPECSSSYIYYRKTMKNYRCADCKTVFVFPARRYKKPAFGGVNGRPDGELYKNRDWLVQKYVVEQKSTREIQELCSIKAPALYHWFRKFGIRTRNIQESTTLSNRYRKYTDKDWLENQIRADKLSVEIAEKIDCSPATISRWKKKHQITLKTPTRKRTTKFKRIYGKSLVEMGKDLGVSRQRVEQLHKAGRLGHRLEQHETHKMP